MDTNIRSVTIYIFSKSGRNGLSNIHPPTIESNDERAKMRMRETTSRIFALKLHRRLPACRKCMSANQLMHRFPSRSLHAGSGTHRTGVMHRGLSRIGRRLFELEIQTLLIQQLVKQLQGNQVDINTIKCSYTFKTYPTYLKVILHLSYN